MRPIVPSQENQPSSGRASSKAQTRRVLSNMWDFGNSSSHSQKMKKENEDDALVTSDGSSYGEDTENKSLSDAMSKSTKKRGLKANDMATFTTLSSLMEARSEDNDNSGNQVRPTGKSGREMKNGTLPLLRIAEEPDDEEIVFERSFTSPSVHSLERTGSSSQNKKKVPKRNESRFSSSDSQSDIALNLTSPRAHRDSDCISAISWPASEMNSPANVTSRRTRRDDNSELMSFFSEPATEIMGNLTSAGIRKQPTGDSSLHGEQFLKEIGSQGDDESLFSQEGKGAMSMEKVDTKTTPKISNRERLVSTTGIALRLHDRYGASEGNEQTTSMAKDGNVSTQNEKGKDLVIPEGAEDITEQKGGDGRRKMPRTICISFALCTVLVFLGAIVVVVIALPMVMNDAPASKGLNSNSEQAKAIRDIVLKISSLNSLKNVNSSAFRAYNWMLTSDSVSVTETSSEILKERFIVSLLYFATGGATWTEQVKFLSDSSVCNWNNSEENDELMVGVGCDLQSRVKQIVLVDNNLKGRIPTEIAQLNDLEILNLSRNSLNGSIPQEIGYMTALLELNLMENRIGGGVPATIGNLGTLTSLDLSSNKLTGSLPTQLGNLGDLERLSLGDNKLEGTIPGSLQYLGNLIEMNLFRNGFHGDIPSGVAAIPNLAILNFASNRFVGNISDDFCSTGRSYESFWADCRGTNPVVECSCCTLCCRGNGFQVEC